MIRTAPLFALLSLSLMACQKDEERTVELTVSCPSCTLEYRDGSGATIRRGVTDTYTTSYRVEVGGTVYAKVCGGNSPAGGGYVRPVGQFQSNALFVRLDREVGSTWTDSTWDTKLDSVQVDDPATVDPNDLRWRYFYRDTCSVIDQVMVAVGK